MKIFNIFAILILAVLIVGCGAPKDTTHVDSNLPMDDTVGDSVDNVVVEQTDAQVQTEMDDIVIPEDDEVELGELI